MKGNKLTTARTLTWRTILITLKIPNAIFVFTPAPRGGNNQDSQLSSPMVAAAAATLVDACCGIAHTSRIATVRLPPHAAHGSTCKRIFGAGSSARLPEAHRPSLPNSRLLHDQTYSFVPATESLLQPNARKAPSANRSSLVA